MAIRVPETRPKQVLPPRIKVSYPKAMTIALGILCQDGIVLAADTQLTAAGSHKRYASKIFTIHSDLDIPTWIGVITYAGYPAFVDTFNNHFRDEMRSAEKQWPITASLTRDVIKSVLNSLPETDCDNTEILCGIALDEEIKLYKTRGRLVSEVSGHADIGVGDSSVIAYLWSLMARHGIRTTQQAGLLATYLIRAAKAYVDGCGGETEVWILGPSGSLMQCSSVPAVEQHFGMLDDAIGEVLSGLFKNDEGPKFEERLTRMCRRLREERTELTRFFNPIIRRPPQ